MCPTLTPFFSTSPSNNQTTGDAYTGAREHNVQLRRRLRSSLLQKGRTRAPLGPYWVPAPYGAPGALGSYGGPPLILAPDLKAVP